MRNYFFCSSLLELQKITFLIFFILLSLICKCVIHGKAITLFSTTNPENVKKNIAGYS